MIEQIVSDIVPHYGPDTPAAVVYRASWPDQRVIEGTLGDIAGRVRDEEITRTALVIVGRALGDHETVSRLYDSSFTHGHREGADGDAR
jgi:precorrin-4/cobalt-precorrin-4 C11-methyltransferase